jgi:hypothetical protein
MHSLVLFTCPRPRTFCLRAPQNVRTSAWSRLADQLAVVCPSDADNVTGRDYALLHKGLHRAAVLCHAGRGLAR